MQHLPKSQGGAHPAEQQRGAGGGGAWEVALQRGPSKAGLLMQITEDGTFVEVSCLSFVFFIIKKILGLLWHSVVKTSQFHYRGVCLIPGQGTRFHMPEWCGQKS